MIDTGWKQYLVQQAKLHPAMKPQDVYKLIFQAAFGAEHLLQDEEAACAYFQREYEEVMPADELLYEQIHENLYRVNLRAWKKQNLLPEWLFKMFVGSAGKQQKQDFVQYVKIAEEVVKEGGFSFPYKEFLEYSEAYGKQGIRPIHHSERYRMIEKPSYRLINAEYLRVLPILKTIAERMAGDIENGGMRQPYVIAIDGRCASGKSTMARILSEITGAGIVHMDDFFLPMELRTEERLTLPGGNIHYERFQEVVLPFLKKKGEFAYRRFDCGKMQLGERRIVADSLFRIVEGVYSLHPVFGEYADLKVYADVESKMQLERIGRRDGEAVLTMFKEHWIPLEEKYFSAYQIKDRVDLVVL